MPWTEEMPEKAGLYWVWGDDTGRNKKCYGIMEVVRYATESIWYLQWPDFVETNLAPTLWWDEPILPPLPPE